MKKVPKNSVIWKFSRKISKNIRIKTDYLKILAERKPEPYKTRVIQDQRHAGKAEPYKTKAIQNQSNTKPEPYKTRGMLEDQRHAGKAEAYKTKGIRGNYNASTWK